MSEQRDEELSATLRRASEMHPPAVLMAPCPFCGGPPVVDAWLESEATDWREEMVDVMNPERLAELLAAEARCNARVWCHECGAKGPNYRTRDGAYSEPFVDDQAGIDAALRCAAETWNARDVSRHISLYVAGMSEGLNHEPRVDLESVQQ